MQYYKCYHFSFLQNFNIMIHSCLKSDNTNIINEIHTNRYYSHFIKIPIIGTRRFISLLTLTNGVLVFNPYYILCIANTTVGEYLTNIS
jgi:hypothetical protein